jgi:ATP dependent DNA ligase domain
MKAKLVNSIPPGDWIYEVKFDGYRALALRGGPETRLLSRNQKDLGKKFPEILDAIASLGWRGRLSFCVSRAFRALNIKGLAGEELCVECSWDQKAEFAPAECPTSNRP